MRKLPSVEGGSQGGLGAGSVHDVSLDQASAKAIELRQQLSEALAFSDFSLSIPDIEVR